MNRRQFLEATGVVIAASAATPFLSACASAERRKKLSAARLPRWRGFNLMEKFVKRPNGNLPYRETDFEIIRGWGFDFVRLPMSYLCWGNSADWREIDETELKHIDQAVELGRQHRVHVNLNFHRAPGYCVNPPLEPLNLWKDEKALEACCFHWAHFAKRYKGISSTELSFDLLNEPPDIPEPDYVRVVKALVNAIRAEDKERLIIADGLRWGRKPVHGLAGLGIGQSTRGYDPMQISHHKAGWIHGSDKWPEPAWPLKRDDKEVANKETLRKELIQPWKELEEKGVGVHVGEWGAHNKTPHKVALAWMRDCLDLWRETGWGWALWNLRGSFGVLNSQRSDVQYQDFHGHKLDRAMLEILKTG